MRVHELAKEVGLSSKELMARIAELGGEVKSHMAVVDVELLTLIQGKIHKPKKEETEASAPAKKLDKNVAANKKKEAIKEEKLVKEAEVAQIAKNESKGIKVKFPITVGAFADTIKHSVPNLIKNLMSMGVFANVNQLINDEIGLAIAEKLEIALDVQADAVAALFDHTGQDPKKLKPRSPVVTMMGHVDHGKTSLLDAIRKTNVAAGEKGAITQHVGAYNVEIPGKGAVTFLDTPGHEAFTAMRARGANVTDVVVLVVAADDGIMPQTIEAISHAREAGCPIVVAVNKCDLPTANIDKVLRELQQHDLTPEAWGGKTMTKNVSAKTGEGIDDLLDMLLLETEILELKANPECAAAGTVIEAHLSKGAGPVANVIVQKGTMRIGDIVVCGSFSGRVKSLKNDFGKNVKLAGPSYAVQIMGLGGVPEAGDTFAVVDNEKIAKEITQQRTLEKREIAFGSSAKHLSLATLYDRLSEGNFREVKLIIKADVQGSTEALTQALEKTSNDQCHVRVIHSGVGGINESDVMLAAASDAIIIAFHVKPDSKAQALCDKEGVDIQSFNIIYEVVESIKQAMEGLLAPTIEEVIEGHIELRQIFKSSKIGNIGGGMVLDGKIKRTNPVRLIRNNVIIHEGKLAALKRFKDDVKDVSEGYECGVSILKFDDIMEGDIIESYRLDKVATKLQ
jgi:translation initiation factor IF-2